MPGWHRVPSTRFCDATAATWWPASAVTSTSSPMCWCAPLCRSRWRPCLALTATVVIAVISPAAAAVLAVCLLIAGVAAPWLGARAAVAAEHVAVHHHSQRDTAAMLALEHASGTAGRRSSGGRYRRSRAPTTGLGTGDRPGGGPRGLGVCRSDRRDRRQRARCRRRRRRIGLVRGTDHACDPDVAAAVSL